MGDIHYCLTCDNEVAEAGQTCSLDCYAHVVRVLRVTEGRWPNHLPPPLSMERNEWYDREQERIAAFAEEHDVYD